MFTLFAFYFAAGVILILLSIPLLQEKVKPNPYYGFRIRATLEHPEIWYAVNKYFGRRLLVVGVIQCLASVALYFVPGISVDAYALAVLAVMVVAFSVILAQTGRYIKSLS